MPIINIDVKNKVATGDGTKIVCGNSMPKASSIAVNTVDVYKVQ